MEEEDKLTKRERKKLNRQKVEGAKSSSIRNKLAVVGAIVALALGAFWLIYRGGSSRTPQETPVVGSPAEVGPGDNVKGPDNALVTLVEYGDYQCPACANYDPIVSQIAEEFSSDLKVVYRHFPIRSIHRHAQIAAQAAQAAADQGYFWEYSKLLYEKQDEWTKARDPRGLFKEYANELTMNVEQFDSYMNSDEAKKKVNADYDSGVAAGVDSTPTFFINGQKVVPNPQGIEPFRQLIQKAIDQNKPQEESQDEENTASPEGKITPQL